MALLPPRRPRVGAGQRRERNLPNIAEWFQWLAERLQQHGRPEKAVGTHVAFRDWVP